MSFAYHVHPIRKEMAMIFTTSPKQCFCLGYDKRYRYKYVCIYGFCLGCFFLLTRRFCINGYNFECLFSQTRQSCILVLVCNSRGPSQFALNTNKGITNIRLWPSEDDILFNYITESSQLMNGLLHSGELGRRTQCCCRC